MENIVIKGISFAQVMPNSRGGVRSDAMFVTVRSDGEVAVSKALRDRMSRKVDVFCSEDGQHLAIRESDQPTAFTMKKSGGFRAGTLRDMLAERGIQVPCRYEMAQEGDVWLGKMIPLTPPTPKPDTATKKPRKRGLADMMPKGGTTP